MTWQVDKSHSHISFTARHMMISKVRGGFNNFDINVNFDDTTPANSTVEATIYVDSIDTREEKRNAHLRSADFFEIEQFPTMTFKSTRVEQTSPNHGRLIGDLTIRGLTHEVALDVDYSGLITGPTGLVSAGFSAETSISRKEWGLNWNVALESGGWLVSDKIDIEIEVELVKIVQPVAEPA